MNGGRNSAGGAIGALFFAIGALLLFALGFAFFLVLPFFLFLAGIVAMIVSDRSRDPERVAEVKTSQEEAKQLEPAP